MTARVAVERALAHEAMNAGFSAQITVRVIACELDRCALETGHVTVGLFKNFHLETASFAVATIHAKQHLRPVLRLGAAGPGVDVEETVRHVLLAGKHALELKLSEDGVDFADVAFEAQQRGLVAFHLGEFQQLCCALRVRSQRINVRNYIVDQALFFT